MVVISHYSSLLLPKIKLISIYSIYYITLKIKLGWINLFLASTINNILLVLTKSLFVIDISLLQVSINVSSIIF